MPHDTKNKLPTSALDMRANTKTQAALSASGTPDLSFAYLVEFVSGVQRAAAAVMSPHVSMGRWVG